MILRNLLALSLLLTVIDLTSCSWCSKFKHDYEDMAVTEKICCPGYNFRDDTCEPICLPNCPANSRCTHPYDCTCDDGYASSSSISETIVCEPQCTAGCRPHSTCTQPETCTCDLGYTAGWNGTCEPVCQVNCSAHESCTAPNTCSCLEGYILNESLQQCVPECQYGCPLNMYCQSPNQCTCRTGYRLHSNTTDIADDASVIGAQGVCEPTCTKGCRNGRCIEVNVCACNDGYQLSAHDLSKCEPVCSEPCVNADCVAPDLCHCREKYRPLSDGNLTHICTPMCWPECVNGVCVAPDQCSCNYGYMRPSNATPTQMHICEPYCSGCKGGHCVAPSECICPAGLELTVIGENYDCTTITTTTMTTIPTTDAPTASEIETTTVKLSSTESIEWFNDTVEVEVLTEVNTNSNSDGKGALFQPIDLEKCANMCSCWKVHPSDECFVICGSRETRCLEPQFTRCIEPSRRIEYTVSDESKIYTCYMSGFTHSVKTGAAARPMRTIVGLLFTAVISVVFV